jgi:transposase
MEFVFDRCCGVDVHKAQITACIVEATSRGIPKKKEIRQYETFTADLQNFCSWLKENNCKDMAMESTGVYWRPVFNLLEQEGINVCLVNARHIKNVPGRKTDVKDCEWIADLYMKGLLRPSLIPEASIRECRDLIRRRKRLIQLRASEVNRLQKTLESANIKLSSVASNVIGASASRMLHAIIEGERDVETLANMALGTLVQKVPLLKKALQGNIREHHIFMMKQILGHIDFMDTQIKDLSDELSVRLAAYEDDIKRLIWIPGVQRKSAEAIIVETGGNMDAFVNSQKIASWVGLCPGNHQSAGKRLSGRNTNGNQWLRQILIECAQTASRSKDNFLSSRYERLAKRRGAKRSIFALAHRILLIAYNILKYKTNYRELGGNYYQNLNSERSKKYYIKRLESLGFTVSLNPSTVSTASS